VKNVYGGPSFWEIKDAAKVRRLSRFPGEGAGEAVSVHRTEDVPSAAPFPEEMGPENLRHDLGYRRNAKPKGKRR